MISTIISVVLIIFSFLLGALLTVLYNKRNRKKEQIIFGSLVINEEDPTKDIFRIEVDMDLAEVKYKDEVVLKVRNEGSRGTKS